MSVDDTRPPDARPNPTCKTCHHPASHHESGECWTIAATGEESWNPGSAQCPCGWFEAD